MIKLGIIGAGNIIQTRHIPALLKNKKLFDLVGITDLKGDRASTIAAKYSIPNHCSYTKYKSLADIKWFKEVDAVLIGIPPKEHYTMVKQCLDLGKHVLVEKPFVTDLNQGKELIALAKKKMLILGVNHNFQFASSFQALDKVLHDKNFGKIRSFYLAQVSNDARRLPAWGDNLPLGLFYDESPHFFYLLRKFCGGDLKIRYSNIIKSKITANTPQIINCGIDANGIQTDMYLNFESPVCEWYFTVFGEHKLAFVDLFRDIITVLPNDEQHLMKEVFKTSFLATLSHWKGYLVNGFKYIQSQLYYGIDITQENFYNAITEKDPKYIEGMTGEDGLAVNNIQYDIVRKSVYL